MRVFLSWSGPRSQKVAASLRDWLPNVMHAVRPWMSEVDMPMGVRWGVDLARELEQAKIGIICVTAENETAPWILFEAGALSRTVAHECVIPYLLGITPTEVVGPLVQFQAAVAQRSDTFKVVSTINQTLGEMALSESRLERSFNAWWPELEQMLAAIPPANPEMQRSRRPERDLLEEILNLTRQSTREQIEKAAIAQAAAMLRQRDLLAVTHEIQGPLASVNAALTRLSRADLPAKTASSIEHARGLLQDVLQQGYGMTAAFALEEGRGMSLDLTEVDAVSEVREIAMRLQRTRARDDIRFSFTMAHEFPRLMLDRHAFDTVIFNLIDNAMKFADPGSEVSIECDFDRTTNRPVVKIKSVGEPIRPEERQRIFDRHVRGSAVGRGRMRAGAGLGLWISQKLMQELGGDLILELSPSHPRLSIFTLYFGPRALHGSESDSLDR